MKKLRETLRLKFQAKLKNRQIARSLQLSASTVSYYTRAAVAAGLEWPLPDNLNDSDLMVLLEPYCLQLKRQPHQKAAIDFVEVHQEKKRKGVTLELLWQEYAQRFGRRAYSYSEYCRQYRQWRQCQKPSMRQTHRAGEKVFIDYAGPTVAIHDVATGSVLQAVIFIGVLGASNYTFAKAYRSRQCPDWLQANQDMLDYFAGVPQLLIPDNEKAAVKDACYYDPDVNQQYAAFAAHYETTVLPTRPGKPQDKAKVEVAVQIVERWILARLRHHKFFSLSELNKAINVLLTELNNKPFKKLPGTRASQYEALDKPALKPLPTLPFEYTAIKSTQVRLDYHIEADKHFYSVPNHLIGQVVEYRLTAHSIDIYYQHERIASHARSHQMGQATTLKQHMPKAHQQHQQFTPQQMLTWANDIGSATTDVAQHFIKTRPHPECCYRSYLGLRNLAKCYGPKRLEAACAYAVHHQAIRYQSLQSILAHHLETYTEPPMSANDDALVVDTEHHQYLRGSSYYQINHSQEEN